LNVLYQMTIVVGSEVITKGLQFEKWWIRLKSRKLLRKVCAQGKKDQGEHVAPARLVIPWVIVKRSNRM